MASRPELELDKALASANLPDDQLFIIPLDRLGPSVLPIANARDGVAVVRACGQTGGRRPKLNHDQAHQAQRLFDAGDTTIQRIAARLQVQRSTIDGRLNKTSIGRRPTPAPRPGVTAVPAAPLLPGPTGLA